MERWYVLPFLMALVGLYAMLSCLLPTPGWRSRKAIQTYSASLRHTLRLSEFFSRMLTALSAHLQPLIRLNELDHAALERSLRRAGHLETPQAFLTDLLASTLLFLLSGLLFVGLSPLFSLAIAGFGVFHAIRTMADLRHQSDAVQQAVRSELPKFTAYIKQSMRTCPNALILLERYRTENRIFLEHLGIAVADIKTSDFEGAMLRFGSHYLSEELSMIVRGLIGLYNGDDVRPYFEMLERDLTASEINRLKHEVSKLPKKLRSGMILIYAAIALIFFTPVVILILDNVNNFFQ